MSESTEKATGNGNLLAPWEPGQSGNPAGLAKGTKHGLRARITRLLDTQASPDILKILKAKGIEMENSDNAEVIAHVLNREAQKGNMQAIKLMADYTEGDSSDPLSRSINTTILINNATVDNPQRAKVIVNGKLMEESANTNDQT